MPCRPQCRAQADAPAQRPAERYKRADNLLGYQKPALPTPKPRLRHFVEAHRPGEAVPDMAVRITIDPQMNVLRSLRPADAAPYGEHCTSIAPDYGKYLVKLSMASARP